MLWAFSPVMEKPLRFPFAVLLVCRSPRAGSSALKKGTRAGFSGGGSKSKSSTP